MTLRARVLSATNAALADAVIAEARTEGAKTLAQELAAIESFSWASEHDRFAAIMKRVREVIT